MPQNAIAQTGLKSSPSHDRGLQLLALKWVGGWVLLITKKKVTVQRSSCAASASAVRTVSQQCCHRQKQWLQASCSRMGVT